jgi:hypothetical protein
MLFQTFIDQFSIHIFDIDIHGYDLVLKMFGNISFVALI